MRAIAYVRCSSDEQAVSGLGLQAQREAILSEVARRGWTLVAEFEDAGWSAKDMRRPGIKAALDALASGEADALVVARLDRATRSLANLTTLMATAQKQSWALVALDCAVDTSTPTGEAMISMTGVFSQLERRLISERTKAALAVVRAKGEKKLGRPTSIPPTTAKRIARMRKRGMTLQAICDTLNGEGVPTARGGALWRPTSLRAVLRAA